MSELDMMQAVSAALTNLSWLLGELVGRIEALELRVKALEGKDEG